MVFSFHKPLINSILNNLIRPKITHPIQPATLNTHFLIDVPSKDLESSQLEQPFTTSEN